MFDPRAGLIGLLGALIIVPLLFIFTDIGDAAKPPEYARTVIEQGVEVSGYHSSQETGYVLNTNPFDVRVKMVDTALLYEGWEKIVWIKKLVPGERIDMHVSYYHRFYIFYMNGAEIGFIKPVKISGLGVTK